MTTTSKALPLLLAFLLGAAEAQTAASAAPGSEAGEAPPAARATRQRADFASPEQAAGALVEALRTNSRRAMRQVLGHEADRYIQPSDASVDNPDRIKFLAAYDEQSRIEMKSDTSAILRIGKDDWPLPIPIVKNGERWQFDTRAGEQEWLDRRIGANELSAIQVLLAYVDAQREYVLKDNDRDGLLEYAQRIVSTPGQRDGLYWPSAEGEPPSPMGQAFAGANRSTRRVDRMESRPFHGYYFRILTAQGKYAKGGAMDYRIKGKLIGGFGLVGYPADYGRTGIKTFIVNHEGVVYSRDYGPETAARAERMVRFNPGPKWKSETQ
jgi:hypothetical protein